jgi:cysteinyl-tRNA synthetase
LIFITIFSEICYILSIMNIYLTNTLTKNKELFTPLVPGQVGMYHCGPTVYWNQHIGNMRAVVIVDLLHRMFLYNGYRVNLVRNYTDVGHLTGDNIGDADAGEDRMELAVKRDNLSPEEVADKYIAIYQHDIKSLNTLPLTHARATDYISEMIDMVQQLINHGNAYTTPLGVYFDISTYDDYTRLSGQKLENLLSGTGHGDIADTAKRNPGDFALWVFKTGAHENALQTWESPFNSPLVEHGRGFPGWHIECSAMSKHFLGTTFDIHMGGIEHIPIHHTNEIAQSTCANHAPFVNYWLHNEHLLVDNKKMSKSEGTSYLVSDIIDHGYDPLVLRYFFLQANYRSKQNFTWEGLTASASAYEKLIKTLSQFPDGGTVSESYQTLFRDMVSDDLGTAGGLAVVWELLKNSLVSDADKLATILDMDRVLGLKLADKISQLKDKQNEKENKEIPEHIQKLIDERNEMRAIKNWSRADALRDQILRAGFEVID